MLNGNDVQLFYKLLDSLSTSLRELAVKYELLVAASVRQSGDREKTDAAVISMSKELSSAFSTMTKEFEILKGMASASKDHDAKLSSAIENMVRSLEAIDVRIAAAARAAESAAIASRESKDVTVHVDGHMDGFTSQLSSLVTASSNIKKMCEIVESMKQQVEPLKKLALIFTTPGAIIVVLYLIFTTFITVIQGYDFFKSIWEHGSPPIIAVSGTSVSTTSATNAP